MTNSILEITENEYLIKLNRSNFNLSFIRSLLKMVEVANPSEDSDFPIATVSFSLIRTTLPLPIILALLTKNKRDPISGPFYFFVSFSIFFFIL
jgi:hypothetical protein